MNTYLMIIAFIIIAVLGYITINTQNVTIDGMEQRTTTNILLLGDSMLNNTMYVPSNKSVDMLLKKSYPDTSVLAKDKATIKDVYSQLTKMDTKNKNDNTNQFIFLSAGGNDIMGLIDKHGAPSINDNILEKLHEKADSIFSEYVQLVEAIQEKLPGAKLGLFNVYYPVDYSFDYNTDPKIIEDLITYWNEKLSDKFISFNEDKVLLNNPLLIALDEVLTEPSDFINQIEPSIRGGIKIVTLIEKFIQKNPKNILTSQKKPNNI
jgi:hypothetical protein